MDKHEESASREKVESMLAVAVRMLALFYQRLSVCVGAQSHTTLYRYLNIHVCLYSCFTCLSQETLNRPLYKLYIHPNVVFI